MLVLNRRQSLKGLSLGAGSLLLGALTERVMANAEGNTLPPRFVFVLQSNGFDAIQACPETIPFEPYANRELFESTDLTEHRLPNGLAPLEAPGAAPRTGHPALGRLMKSRSWHGGASSLSPATNPSSARRNPCGGSCSPGISPMMSSSASWARKPSWTYSKMASIWRRPPAI